MTDDAPRSHRRAWIGWTVFAVIVVVVFCAGWIVIRGIGAAISLASAADGAKSLRAMVSAGETDSLDATAKRLEADTANARTLTDDPIWRAAEWTPWLGGNLRAVRQISEVGDDIVGNGLAPLLDAARGSDLATLGISDGHMDLAPLAKIAPDLQAADTVMSRAQRAAAKIDGNAAIGPLADAVAQLKSEIRQVARATSMLSGAAQLLPTMLGGSEPRTYLVLMQNNAELRTWGGNPGALALVHANNGTVTLGTQSSTSDFRRFASSVLPLSDTTTVLFGDDPGRRMRDTTAALDFPTAAQLASTMWTKKMGGHLDGVIAVDAVAIRYLLEATGPLTVDGVEINSKNATEILLGDVYERFSDAKKQDDFFRNTARTLFASLTSGKDPHALLSAFGQAGDSNRVRVWSANPQEQQRVLRTSLSGTLGDDSADTVRIAVRANDTTGGKMDYFANAAVSVDIGACGKDGHTVMRVTVDWSSSAPKDAATSLADWVTAAGWWGVPPGITGTRIAILGPQGWTRTAHSTNGEVHTTAESMTDRRTVVQDELWTPPGGSQRMTVEFTSPDSGTPFVDVRTTPMVNAVPVTVDSLTCG